MADCSFARCVQERRAIRRELQRWTKNMVYVLGLERVAEELMGRRKWKLYQDTLLSRNNTGDSDSAGSAGSAGGDEVEERPKEQAMPAAAPDPSGSPPAPSPSLKIKTIEEINTTPSSQTTILEALIKRAPPPPSVPVASTASQPEDWRPADKCYFCVDGEPAQAVQGTPPRECSEGVDEGRSHGLGGARATSPANSSASASSIESRRSPEPPALLQHLLQLQQTPQALAQFQRMAAQLAVALSGAGGLLVPPGIIPPWYLQVAQHNQMMNQHNQHNQQNDRVSSEASASGAESVGAAAEAGKSNETSSTSGARETEQPLDLSAKSGSGGSTASTPPPPPLHNSLPTVDVNNYLRNRMQPSSALGGLSAGAVGVAAAAAASAAAGARRAYTEDELQMALRDIQSGKLGTRRAAVLYGIPRSTLRNKVYKMSADRGRAPDPHDPHDDDDERDDDEWPNTTAGPYASYGVGVAGYSPYGSYAPYIRTLLQAAKRENDDERDEASAKHILKIPSFRFPPGSPNTDDDATQTTTQHTHVSQHAQHTQHTHPQHVPHAPAYSPLNRPPPEPAADAFRRALAAAPPHTPPARQVPVIQRQYGEPGTNATNAADDRAQTASTSGGKGTRPKRGKYRNYDRDSLVEAVKAVQRGEMSVHRAGSYYGVPHSTLEYKVKERHLMRPRKREPKPPAPPDDRTKPGERAKPPAGQLKLAQGKPFAPGVGPVPSGSNGVKQGAFTAPGFPFWPHATAAGFPAPSAFPPAPELFASHMMQRLRDESSRSPTAAATTVATHATHTTHANGSFLESVIRSSLERRSDALLERRSDAVLERRPDNVLERRSDAVLERRTDNALERRSDALLERLTRNDGEDEPPPRRPRLSSADRLLAEQMRDAVKQLRTDKLRPSNGANDESPPASHVPAVSSHAPVSHASTAAPHAQEQL